MAVTEENLILAFAADVEQVEVPASTTVADLLPWAVPVLLLLAGLFVLRKVLQRRKLQMQIIEPELVIDLETLDCEGPPDEGPVLEFYHLPVRLAVLVLAPAGRGHELPPPEEIPAVVDMILPGLARVVETHGPVYRRWPAQVSWRGFAHTFFTQVRLPGDAGRGTPWSSVAGIVKTSEGSVMAGLILRTEQATGFGREIIEREGEWLRVLQIRPE